MLHRDLKPANVMIDGNGQVRITDFGLAAIAGQVDQVRVGTPAYMAPEQLSGKGVSIQSDLYALGLVLYEVFTGRRAYTAQNVGELVAAAPGRRHHAALDRWSAISTRASSARFSAASSREPAGRPRSALAVAASLPGGDPLAAALAAGETPSPEMVAAAGERKAASMTAVLLATAAVLGMLAVGVVLTGEISAVQPRAVRQVAGGAGGPRPASPGGARVPRSPADTHWGFDAEDDYLQYVREHAEYARARDPFATRPNGLLFYYRTSPRRMCRSTSWARCRCRIRRWSSPT